MFPLKFKKRDAGGEVLNLAEGIASISSCLERVDRSEAA